MIFMRSPLGSRFQAVSYSDIADFLGSLLFTWLIVQNCELFKYGFQSLIGPVLNYLSQVIDYPGVYNPKISALLWGAV